MTQPPYPGPDEQGAPDPTGGSEVPPPTHQPYGQPYPQQPPPYGEQPPAYGQPYGQSPYGQSPYGAHGQQPYGAYGQPYGAYGQANDPNRGWSGVAIAALVTSLTCCLGFVGVILGVIGIFRTGEGKGKGRWMAVTGIVVGLLGTVGAIGFGVLVAMGLNTITPDNAEVGMCVDVDHRDDAEIGLTEKDCTEEHDGQIYGVHELTAAEADELDRTAFGQVKYCRPHAEEHLSVTGTAGFDEGREAVIIDGERVRFDSATVDPENPQEGDKIVCYFEATMGGLDKDLVD